MFEENMPRKNVSPQRDLKFIFRLRLLLSITKVCQSTRRWMENSIASDFEVEVTTLGLGCVILRTDTSPPHAVTPGVTED